MYYVEHAEEHREYDKKYRTEHLEEIHERQKVYRAENPEKIRRRKQKHYEEHKEYYREWHQRDHAEHPERARERNKKRRAEHPEYSCEKVRERRARKRNVAGGHFTEKEWQELLDMTGHKCLCCGATNVPLQRDHIVPLGPPHSDEITNIQPLCVHCNTSKQRKTINYKGDMTWTSI